MIYCFIFIFGLVIGSFLNAVIYRLKTGESIVWPGSHCPKCSHKLGFLDLIPILSFIFLKAKCRYCHKKISWQYPLVELITAALFVLGYWQSQSFLIINHKSLIISYLIYLIFTTFLIIIFVYDLKYYQILDKISIPAFIIAIIANLYLGKSIINLLIAAIAIGGFFLIQFVVSRGKWIGGGDIRLGLVMGAMLGWPSALVALLLAYFSGAIVGLIMLALQRANLKSQLPFGVFLCPATIVAYLWAEPILHWYLTRII